MQSLSGAYEGDCKNGKANGYGKATGEDSYEGNFSNGLPEGEGKYTWKDGRTYVGHWIKGVQDGKGVMLVKNKEKEDTLQEGYWKKGTYIGKYLLPYLVHTRTKMVSSVTCRKVNTLSNEIAVTIESTMGNEVNGISTSTMPVDRPTITNFQLVYGTYQKETTDDRQLKKMVYRYETVTFPFRAQIYVGTEMVEIELLEAGNWLLEIKLNQ